MEDLDLLSPSVDLLGRFSQAEQEDSFERPVGIFALIDTSPSKTEQKVAIDDTQPQSATHTKDTKEKESDPSLPLVDSDENIKTDRFKKMFQTIMVDSQRDTRVGKRHTGGQWDCTVIDLPLLLEKKTFSPLLYGNRTVYVSKSSRQAAGGGGGNDSGVLVYFAGFQALVWPSSSFFGLLNTHATCV